MTNSSEKASNWHGVTVDVKKKKYKYKQNDIIVADLPGIYSLKGYSNEEMLAIDYLNKHKDNIIINICDANNIKRNLKLTCDLLNKGFKVLVIVNMNNEIKICNYEKLEKIIGTKIIPIDARKKRDINKINNYLLNYAKKYKMQNIINNNINHAQIIKNKEIFTKNNPYKITDKIDKVILNKWLFIPIFLLILFIVFFVSFGNIGCFITDTINIYLNKIANLIKILIKSVQIPLFIRCFLCEAIIDSCFSILSFLPQIVILMFFINLIEDIGLMSRFSFMFDGFLKKIGLTGKSVFSIFMGFGCSTSAVLTSRNLESERLKKSTIASIAFIPCSAKLPIFLVIASLFFENYKYLIVFALYIFSVIISIVAASIFNKKNKKNEEFFIIEMPKMRLPNLKKILKDIVFTIKEFLKKITKSILFFSIIVWILQNISIQFNYLNGENFNQSLLYFFASKVSFLFAPIGLDNVGIIVALLLGLCAKELIVVGLYVINGVEPSISALSASLLSNSSICSFSNVSSIIFLTFILLYSPCVSALSVIKSETNKKYFIKLVVIQMMVAYMVSFILYMVLTEINYLYLIFSVILVVLLIKVVLKFKNKEKFICQGSCDACRKV